MGCRTVFRGDHGACLSKPMGSAVRKLGFVAPGTELRAESFRRKWFAEFSDQECQVAARARIDNFLQDPLAPGVRALRGFGSGSSAA